MSSLVTIASTEARFELEVRVHNRITVAFRARYQMRSNEIHSIFTEQLYKKTKQQQTNKF